MFYEPVISAASSLPWSETERLAALRSYGVLDTPREHAFDALTQVAALVCKAPIALVSFVEDTRQFFKSEVGMEVNETPMTCPSARTPSYSVISSWCPMLHRTSASPPTR